MRMTYNMKEARQRTYLSQKMGRLWRIEKSQIVSKIQKASSDEELVKLKPSNVQSMGD
ncbi:unnamed protein product [Citrullus colocynthis]|uniref:Uncharacterized protein n=1 Tax=Citrullus colocynthis TaxID=252529 RepID=A0ABP0YZQ7_9ROSI